MHGLLNDSALIKMFMDNADSPKTPLYQAALRTRSFMYAYASFTSRATPAACTNQQPNYVSLSVKSEDTVP